MANELTTHHRLIERPCGISGIRPGFWCAVCGRRADSNKDTRCYEEGCPNLCHAKCLFGSPEYRCDNTAQLRDEAGIEDPVIFTTRATSGTTCPTESSDSLAVSTQVENVDNLTRVQLISLVRDLRTELIIRDEDTNAAFELLDEVPNLRSAAVKTISILDSLLALKDNLRSKKVIKEKQSIACTATPEDIDCEWSEHVANNREVQEWWDLTQQSEAEGDSSLLSILALPPSGQPCLSLTHTPAVAVNDASSVTASSQQRCDSDQLATSPPPPHTCTPHSTSQAQPPPSHPYSSSGDPPTSLPSPHQPLANLSLGVPPALLPPPAHTCSPPSSHHTLPQPGTGDDPPRPAPLPPVHLSRQRPETTRASIAHPESGFSRPGPPHSESQYRGQHHSRNQGRRRETNMQTRDGAGIIEEAIRKRQNPRLGHDMRPRQDNWSRQDESPRQGTRPWQDTCRYCHKQGHTKDQCLRRVICEYCQGRYHTAQTCRERQADIRHQDLIEAVTVGRRETLTLLKSFPLPGYPHNAWTPTLPSPQAAPTRHFVPQQGVTYPPTLYTHHQAFQPQQTQTRAF